MGYDGSGNYNRQHNFSADASAGINILAARMDAEIDDIASALENIVWARDGQNTPTTDIPMGGRKFVGVAAATSVSNYMRVREFIENVPIFMQDVESSADRISVSSQYFTSVSANQGPGDGTRILVRANSNKSSAVLYLDGHSANVEYQNGHRMGQAMVSAGIYDLVYSSTDTAWKLQNPSDPREAIQYGAAGDGGNDTTALQAWLDSGQKHLLLPKGSFGYSALTLSASDVTITGEGTLVHLAGTDGRFNISGSGNKLSKLRFNGTAAATTPGPANDCIRITGDYNEVDGCYINGSEGCGVRIEGAAGNKITNNHIFDCYQSNIAVMNNGADNNLIHGNTISGCDTQNNIYLTADDGGFSTPDFIYGNTVTDNHCLSAFDTGVEVGYQCVGTTVKGNRIRGCKNPAILLRDCIGSIIEQNNIYTDTAVQNADYSAIAVTPGTGANNYTFDYKARIANNTILGACARAAIYLGGSGIDVIGNTAHDNETSINATTGAGLVGYGITMGPSVTDIRIIGNTVRRFEKGIDLNFDATAITLSRVEVRDNTIYEVVTGINCFNVTFSSCVIKGNKIKSPVSRAVLLLSSVSPTELAYSGNIIDLSGFSGASPNNQEPATFFAFTGTLTGIDSVQTGSIEYAIDGDQVTLEIPAISGTSNTTAATITGMPAALRPAAAQTVIGITTDNGTTAFGKLIIGTDGVITLHVAQSATFTGAGTKGIAATTVNYRLN